MSVASSTPLTNRGVKCAEDEEVQHLTALIDWCQITVHDVSPEMIANDILQIPFHIMSNDLRGGIRGYKASICFDDIRILEGISGSENGYQILMSGRGCRNYEKFLEAREQTWYDFLERVLTYNVNFPRIDLAIDDRKTYFKIPTLIRMSKKGLVVSRLKIASEQGSFKLKDGSTQGQTLNFGSRDSQFFMTLYEKNYEQANKFDMSDEEMEKNWNRYELKFRQNRAVALANELVKRREVFTVAMEVLNESIRFVKKPENSEDNDIRRYPTWQPWAWFMRDVGKLNLCMQPDAKDYLSMLRWVDHSCGPTLKIIRTIDNIFGTNYLDEIIDNATLTKKHENLLEQCVKQVSAFLELGIAI